MVIIFGVLIVAALMLLDFLAIGRALKAVMEKVEAHLFDKAESTAALFDAKVENHFTYLEGIARMHELHESSVSMNEKILLLKKEADKKSWIKSLTIGDLDGNYYKMDGTSQNISSHEWFSVMKRNNLPRFYSKPFISAVTNTLIIVVAVPIYDDNGTKQSLLIASIDGLALCDYVKDITVGKTGSCYIIDKNSVILAHKNTDMVKTRFNILESAKNNPSLKAFGTFIKKQLETKKSQLGYYEYDGKHFIACTAMTKTI